MQKEGHQTFQDDGSREEDWDKLCWDLSDLFTSWYGFSPKTDKQILSFFKTLNTSYKIQIPY